MSKLDDWQAAINEYDKLIADRVDWLTDTSEPIDWQTIARQALKVALAAEVLLNEKPYKRLMGDGTFIWHECIFCEARLEHRHKDDCPVKQLQDALREIES